MEHSELIQYLDRDERGHVGYLVKRGWKWTRIRRILPAGVKPTKRGLRAEFITVATARTFPVERPQL